MTINRARELVSMFSGRFYEKRETIDGHNTSIFNYHIAPTPKEVLEHPGLQELRGLTFVDDVPFYSMPKFFNVDEGHGWMVSDLEDVGMKARYEKMDGSLIHCVLFDSRVVAKSKGSFSSAQALMAQSIIDSDTKLRTFISFYLMMGLHPIFELVGPDNRHVLNYDRNKLVLLDVREESSDSSGTFSEMDFIGTDLLITKNMEIVERVPVIPLGELMELQKTKTDCEGWVVHFENGRVAKFKTRWYFENHRLVLGDDMNRIDGIVSRIIGETIDDAISAMESLGQSDKVESVKRIINKFNIWYGTVSSFLDDVFRETPRENQKELALGWAGHRWFSIIMKARKTSDDEGKHAAIMEYVERQLRTMTLAERWWEIDVLSTD